MKDLPGFACGGLFVVGGDEGGDEEVLKAFECVLVEVFFGEVEWYFFEVEEGVDAGLAVHEVDLLNLDFNAARVFHDVAPKKCQANVLSSHPWISAFGR